MSIQDTTVHYPVCYADTDAGGIVYHARYIEMVERARNKLMNLAGFTFSRLAKQYQLMLVIHKVEAVYFAPAFLEDELRLNARLSKCEASRTVWVTDVTRGDTLLASISMEIVALNTSTRQLMRFPDAFLDALAPYVEVRARPSR